MTLLWNQCRWGDTGEWAAQVDVMAKNIKDKVRELKTDGVVGMSKRNMRQVVSTRGISVSPSAFDRLLDEAIKKAGVGRFIYEGSAKDGADNEATMLLRKGHEAASYGDADEALKFYDLAKVKAKILAIELLSRKLVMVPPWQFVVAALCAPRTSDQLLRATLTVRRSAS